MIINMSFIKRVKKKLSLKRLFKRTAKTKKTTFDVSLASEISEDSLVLPQIDASGDGFFDDPTPYFDTFDRNMHNKTVDVEDFSVSEQPKFFGNSDVALNYIRRQSFDSLYSQEELKPNPLIDNPPEDDAQTRAVSHNDETAYSSLPVDNGQDTFKLDDVSRTIKSMLMSSRPIGAPHTEFNNTAFEQASNPENEQSSDNALSIPSQHESRTQAAHPLANYNEDDEFKESENVIYLKHSTKPVTGTQAVSNRSPLAVFSTLQDFTMQMTSGTESTSASPSTEPSSESTQPAHPPIDEILNNATKWFSSKRASLASISLSTQNFWPSAPQESTTTVAADKRVPISDITERMAKLMNEMTVTSAVPTLVASDAEETTPKRPPSVRTVNLDEEEDDTHSDKIQYQEQFTFTAIAH